MAHGHSKYSRKRRKGNQHLKSPSGVQSMSPLGQLRVASALLRQIRINNISYLWSEQRSSPTDNILSHSSRKPCVTLTLVALLIFTEALRALDFVNGYRFSVNSTSCKG
ncbi:hypothetical protein E2C01_019768 [Portunus trituberculatus]|uniref:Uncharacterized protein n=1 Tax=Portunus trituberculatus TaxID=210409 RepID=A0A5B7E1D1_PORTR|nr:hypothetical protein [Portunus trituberculatus]